MTYDPSNPLLKQLHEAAKVEKDELVKYNLNLCKDELWDAFRLFTDDPTGDHLADVNGKWAHGVRLLAFTTNKNGSGGGAGMQEGALLTLLAA